MVRINWHGRIINGTPIRQVDGGDWLVQALDHGPRFDAGTILRVMPSEFVDGPPQPGNEADMSANSLAEKMQAAAGAAADIATTMEAQADALLARRGVIEARSKQVFAQHQAVLDMADKGLDALESALAPISNAPVSSTQ